MQQSDKGVRHIKTAIITGASRGIGAATAIAFAKSGCNVAVNYLNSAAQAQELAAVITDNYGVSAAAIRADVSDSEQAKHLIDEAIRLLGGADILVNNAGIAQQKLFTDITPHDWSTMIATDLSSVYNCCHAAVKSMINNKYGRIINISSMWGQTGASCEVHYSAAKAGVIGFTKALAKELAPSGITVNCICPGVIDTDMNSALDSDTVTELTELTPVGRLGSPRDVADTAVFFGSDRADFITGQVIGVNGGFVI